MNENASDGSKAETTPELRLYEVSQLHVDPENPRLPDNVDGHDEAAVMACMLADATILELIYSIAVLGYFSGEPLLIAPDASDRLIVVEGNRRLAALRLLQDPSSAPSRKRAVEDAAKLAKAVPTRVPCVRFENRNDILDYLGYRHITGIIEVRSFR